MMAQSIAHPAFDTLKFVQKLKAAGMPEPQAIALTEAQNEAIMESTDHTLATKADLFDVKQELKQDILATKADLFDVRLALKQEIAGVKQEISEVKQEIANVKYELKQDMNDLKNDLRQEFKQDRDIVGAELSAFRVELVKIKSSLKQNKWVMSFMLSGIGTLILKAFFT